MGPVELAEAENPSPGRGRVAAPSWSHLSMRRLMQVSTLARYAAQQDAPETVRPGDARSAKHGIRWHEDLASGRRRGAGSGWIWGLVLVLAAAAALALLG